MNLKKIELILKTKLESEECDRYISHRASFENIVLE